MRLLRRLLRRRRGPTVLLVDLRPPAVDTQTARAVAARHERDAFRRQLFMLGLPQRLADLHEEADALLAQIHARRRLALARALQNAAPLRPFDREVAAQQASQSPQKSEAEAILRAQQNANASAAVGVAPPPRWIDPMNLSRN